MQFYIYKKIKFNSHVVLKLILSVQMIGKNLFNRSVKVLIWPV